MAETVPAVAPKGGAAHGARRAGRVGLATRLARDTAILADVVAGLRRRSRGR